MFTLDEFREATKAGIKKVLKKSDDVIIGDEVTLRIETEFNEAQ